MKVYTFSSSYPFGSNMYIIESNGEFAVIDPSLDFDSTLRYGFQSDSFKYIILTHGHFDHMLFIDSWCESTGLPIHISENDVRALTDSRISCYKQFLGIDRIYEGEISLLNDSDVLPLGNTEIKVISTPGHTKGAIALLCEHSLFVGDTVFAQGGIGRTDLPGGNFSQLMQSIEKLKSFDSSLTVYSGHGPLTTISNIIKGK